MENKVKNIKVNYGKKQFLVETTFENRKTARITVYPDKNIIAKFPNNISNELVKDYLQKKGKWINKKIQYFDKFHPLPTERKYIRGESYYYLGRQYQLNIKESSDNLVKMKGREIIVYTQDPYNNIQVKDLLLKWYKEHSIVYISKKIEEFIPQLKKIEIETPEIRFRKMKTRWGSCRIYRNKKKPPVITINTELIKAPIYCIDYVIIHEFIHLKFMNHNNKFYRMLDMLLPDWEKRKAKLEYIHIVS